MKKIKIVSSDPGDLNQKLIECKTMNKLGHPNINKYKSYFIINDTEQTLCILFDYCDRGDL